MSPFLMPLKDLQRYIEAIEACIRHHHVMLFTYCDREIVIE